jgi:hypothetical protein
MLISHVRENAYNSIWAPPNLRIRSKIKSPLHLSVLNREKDRETKRQTDRQTQMNNRQKNRETDREMDGWMNGQIDRLDR